MRRAQNDEEVAVQRSFYLRASARVGANACLSFSSDQKKSPRVTPEGSKMVGHPDWSQTINVILPNTLHGSKKKNV